ncbi:hypothetical protein [Bdellovibrio sp. HCB337]|uniref:hypothetical protein n=1 Tax=Bdellovibrio sp. HCB337 TaxID=3394358 RepID=UPI0039A499E8
MNLKNNRGQFVVEAVLLMVLSLGLLSLGLRTLRDGNVLGSFISGPWERVAGMIESGSWEAPDAAAKKHPNQVGRSLSLDPK